VKRRSGLYEVTGMRNFRGHLPGARFVATLDPLQESRAVARGDIARLEEFRPSIQPGALTLPVGWLTTEEEAGQHV
jgi:hypothetical protein